MSDTRRNSMKELRIALVCYGGVSLAIYMHGVTKEIFKLVRAARAFEAAWEQDAELRDPRAPFPADVEHHGAVEYDTENAYFAALVALARAGTPMTVVLDIVTGTSAGGINGVFLARALAEERSLNGLRSVWLEEGDLNRLLCGPALFPFGGQVGIFVKFVESLAHLAGHHHAAPLDGTLMSDLLFRALHDMQKADEMREADGGPLVSPDNGLDLVTTATDVRGYDTFIATGSGQLAHSDFSFRQAMRFHLPPGATDVPSRFQADFGDASIAALAFAARASSSFPGAFPPVSVSSFLTDLGEAGVDATDDSIATHFVYASDANTDPSGSWYMDGGVLDNGPFDLCLDLIAEKRSDRGTSRQLVYIEPDPGGPTRTTGRSPRARPTWFETIWAAKVTVPQHVPFVGALDELRAMNDTITQVGSIVEHVEKQVMDSLATAIGAPDNGASRSYDEIQALSTEMWALARQHTGMTYPAYCRLRAEAMGQLAATTLARLMGFPSRSNRARLIGDVLQSWIRSLSLWNASDTASLENQLEIGDLTFRQRRTEFLLQGVNAAFATTTDPVRLDRLSEVKAACWRLLIRLNTVAESAAAAVVPAATALFATSALRAAGALTSPDAFATTHAAELDKVYRDFRSEAAAATGSSRELWEVLTAATADWDPDARAALVGRYVGFPLWDALVFPTIALSGVSQLSPIGVRRFSPLDADTLASEDADGRPQPKLRGTTLAHFGGFFSAGWRQNDYLWGRLDGVELILGTLGHEAPSVDLSAAMKTGFEAVLRTEREALPLVADDIDRIARQVSQLRPGDR